MAEPIQERRRFPRVNKTFVVSYSIYGDSEKFTDISQTKNISLGGILMTTDIQIVPGTVLALKLKLPIKSETVNVLGRVISSHRVVNQLIYDTHIEFIDVDEANKDSLHKTMNLFVKKEEEEKK